MPDDRNAPPALLGVRRLLRDEDLKETFVERFLAQFHHWETPWSPEDAEQVWAIFCDLVADRASRPPLGAVPTIVLSPEERAQRLLDGRRGWLSALRDTGGGVLVCSVERTPEDEAAPYAWVTASDDPARPYEVGIYVPGRREEPPLTALAETDLEPFVFSELARLT